MRLKSRLNFTGEWSHIIPEVAKQCGMTVDNYCMRCVMLVTKQGIEGGEKQSEDGISQDTLDRTRELVGESKPDPRHLTGEQHGSGSQESRVADGQVSPSQDDSGATLADSEDTGSTPS